MRYPDASIPIAVGATNVSALSTVMDTKGFRYARIACVAVPEVALSSSAGANKLSESDDGYTFTEIPGAVSGTDFTPPTKVGATTKPLATYDVDLRGRKRFIKVDFATATTTQPMIVANFDGGAAFNQLAPILAGIYGGERARRFVKDVVSGSESLDIVYVGDSNGGHENHGYVEGISYGLRTLGAPVYSSPLLPGATAAPYILYLFPGSTYGYAGLNTGWWQGSESGIGAQGSAQSYPEINDYWNSNGGKLLWSSPAYWDWFYVTTSATSNSAQIIVTTSAAMPITAEHIWRVGTATFDTGAGELNLKVVNGTNGATVVDANLPSNKGANGFEVNEIIVPANPSRNFGLTFRFYQVAPVSPAGVLWTSIYQRRKGFACQPFHWGSGQDVREIGNACENSAMMRTFLAELRARQIAAGGKGRVLVAMNAGVNEISTPSDWPDGADAIRDGFRAAWNQLGFPSDDLAFLFGVSHQRAAVDDLAPHRALMKEWVDGKSDSTVYDMADQSRFDVMNNQTMLKDSNLVHMYASGYNYVCLRLISSLVADIAPSVAVRL